MLLEILRFHCDKNSSHFVNNQTGTALIYINKKHWKFIILWRPAVSNIFKCNVRGYKFLTGLLSQK